MSNGVNADGQAHPPAHRAPTTNGTHGHGQKGKKKTLAADIQKRAFEYGTHVPLGEYFQPAAVRKGITGLVTAPGNLYWNIQKP